MREFGGLRKHKKTQRNMTMLDRWSLMEELIPSKHLFFIFQILYRRRWPLNRVAKAVVDVSVWVNACDPCECAYCASSRRFEPWSDLRTDWCLVQSETYLIRNIGRLQPVPQPKDSVFSGFFVHTGDYRGQHESTPIVKFADDTVAYLTDWTNRLNTFPFDA